MKTNRTRSVVTLLAVSALTTAAACSSVLGFEPLHKEAATDASPDGAVDASSDAVVDGSVDEGGGDATPCVADLSTDTKNCGRCAHDCLGGECTESVCRPIKLADGLGIPEGIAVDATSVFVAAYDENRILKFDKSKPSGCTTPPTPARCVFTQDQTHVFKPTAMAVDGTRVYWTNAPPNGAHEIRSCPVGACGGSAAATVASLGHEAFGHLFGDEVLPLALILRGGRVYWPESNGGAIRSALLNGTDKKTHFESGGFMPLDIAVDDDHIYFTDDTNQHPTVIQAVPIAGGAVEVLASTPARPFGIALSESSNVLFWTVQRVGMVGDGVVQAAPKTGLPGGGSPVGALATQQIEPNAIIADDRNVYWAQAGDENTASGMIVYCPQSGCPTDGPIVLASQQNRPRHIAQDADAIYWSNEGLPGSVAYDGQVWKVSKP